MNQQTISTPNPNPASTPDTLWLKIAAINLAAAVALGAFGAHGLKSFASEYALGIWQTATLYLFVHALGLLALGVACVLGRLRITLTACLLQLGVLIFSGSLYALALGAPKFLGAITPIGGMTMIVGWLTLCFVRVRQA
ncbi:hypothetical protein B0181_01280 [Moraxella caviae]|uniref:Protein of uncharacterized function (DUF423) n=1 Tax=Moraxella caviae TaxID=34060 RepID=A0A1T0AAR1_9GAMM|nr:DUF423 domain-containing protein [Moraxella caviae]OOR92795.1 hypothetical protein B0181_01280 [Moraxella caviae]STZ14168.1 Protein of uncharacterised function (DUF423) [Moraxella caviae]VEW12614.1 Protein of uncharacterised function (DUF423) [Moraxella caviae]